MLPKLFEARLPVMLVGAPGVGKSDIVAQAAKACGYDLVISHPVVSDPTDFKGLPWPAKSGETAEFLPFGDFARVLNSEKPTVWFLDDLGQAPVSVQAACMQLLLARRVNGHALPEHVAFAAATNRRTDKAGVQGILEPVKSRFATILEIEASADDWSMWAIENGIRPEIIAFIRFRPALLHDFKPGQDMENSPCPRAWASVSKLMALDIPEELELQAYAGAVGEGAAVEFMSFLKLYRSLPNLDAILLDPDSAQIPDEPSKLYATVTGLAAKANAGNAQRVFRYAERLREAGHGEFSVLLVRDSLRRCPEIKNTAAFIKLAAGPVGKIFLGD